MLYANKAVLGKRKLCVLCVCGGGGLWGKDGVDNLMFRKGWHGDDAMVIYVNVNMGKHLHCSCRVHLFLFLMHNLYTRMVVQQ